MFIGGKLKSAITTFQMSEKSIIYSSRVKKLVILEPIEV